MNQPRRFSTRTFKRPWPYFPVLTGWLMARDVHEEKCHRMKGGAACPNLATYYQRPFFFCSLSSSLALFVWVYQKEEVKEEGKPKILGIIYKIRPRTVTCKNSLNKSGRLWILQSLWPEVTLDHYYVALRYLEEITALVNTEIRECYLSFLDVLGTLRSLLCITVFPWILHVDVPQTVVQ
jgi:hypothetical protein